MEPPSDDGAALAMQPGITKEANRRRLNPKTTESKGEDDPAVIRFESALVRFIRELRAELKGER